MHAGYAKRRRALLQSGVQLYELERVEGWSDAEGNQKSGGSSSASLHAKTFAVDRERIFVGSFNFDPRSARLNTEMGLVLYSPDLAQRLSAMFDTEVPRRAYEVRLAEDGRSLIWIERTAQGEKVYHAEPDRSVGRRMGVDFMTVLPIAWLL